MTLSRRSVVQCPSRARKGSVERLATWVQAEEKTKGEMKRRQEIRKYRERGRETRNWKAKGEKENS